MPPTPQPSAHQHRPRTTVRDAVHDLMRWHNLDIVFGNPGSNELPFLRNLPARYILGLQESAVLAMADGYAQVSGRPTLVNLHAASGTGNALGVLTNAAVARSKLVITAGQQVRSMVGLDAMLANAEATLLPRPLVRFSAEPLCAEDTPRAFSNAVLAAEAGPAYLSIPYDDWDRPAPDTAQQLRRNVAEGREPGAALLELVRRRLSDAANAAPPHASPAAASPDAAPPVALVLGADMDREEAWEPLIALAQRHGAHVWGAPSLSRLPFPNRHPLFQGILPAGIRSIGRRLSEYRQVLVLGAPIFRYHQWEPGAYLGPGTQLLQITTDADAAARAPFGESLKADPLQVVLALAAEGLAAQNLAAQDRELPHPEPRWRPIPRPPQAPQAQATTLHPEEVFAALRGTVPANTRFVVESTSTNAAFWAQMDLRRPGSYFFPAAGGLGWGLPASLGVALADGTRGVVAIIGDGAAHYSLSALYTAVRERIPVIVVVLRNRSYGALDWFAGLLGVPDAPGLQLGAVDFVSIARGYGMSAAHAGSATQLRELLRAALRRSGTGAPTLIEVDTLLTTPEPPTTTHKERTRP